MKQSRPRLPGAPKKTKPRRYGAEPWVEKDGRAFDVLRPGVYWRRRLPGAE